MNFHFDVVLFEPEIPPNTGNVGRLCVGTQSTLHLIEPLGFDIDAKAVRRAGLDYWKWVDLKVHKDWDAFLEWRTQERPELPLFFIETWGDQSLYETRLPQACALIFGKETTGIPQSLFQKERGDYAVTVPMFSEHIRSLNLSNTVSLVLYEGIRQALQSS